MRGPSEGLHEGPALGRGGRGKGATPQPMAGPQGRDCHAAPPPPAVRRRRQGTRGPPPLPPPPAPSQLGSHGRGPPPPRSRGGDAVEGAAAGPAPASPHWRAGATRTTEQYGGRAPHDPPVTTAHSGRAEGGFRSARAPGGAVHRPPLTPPQPGAALRPRPHAHAGGERAGDTKGARIEYRRPPPRRGAGRPRRNTPPPAPPPARGPRGPRPPPPQAAGMAPPPPEGGAGARPAPPPQPPAPMGAAKNKRARACAPGRRTDRTQRSLLSTNQSGMGGHAPHGQHNASDACFVACPGKAEGRNEAERPPALQAPPPGRTTGGYSARPPPPARPPAHERHRPAPRRAAPTRRAGRGDRAGPPHPHARAQDTWTTDPDSPPSGRAVGGGGAHDTRRPSQR